MEDLEALRREGRITEVTYQILIRLVKRKDKKEIYKHWKFLIGCVLLLIYGAVLYYLFIGFANTEPNPAMIAFIFDNHRLWQLGFVLLVSLFVWKFINKKYDDADDDYEDLRKEIIDRGDELWFRQMDTQVRAEVLEILDAKLKINLYHK
ncbi:DUF2663 family protein [Camelliibacillus cellulosilyticus]|uniref:DUF2663 family protein n=1 Tax=Camelliibacillus cellulosilyticus TaxID=2174486 RepID=A0ABV9GKQ9_9BACL